MDTNKLKTYAQAARREFIEAVTERAHHYGLKENSIVSCEVKGDFAIINGSAFPKQINDQRIKLEEQVNSKGFSQVMEEVAYTWFNRFAAIRYMELHGFLSHGYRVLSHPEENSIPEILEKAQHVDLASLDKEEVIKLKMDGTKDEELYSKLLIAECNELSKAMPFLFEQVTDYTELLLPDSLLHSDSIIRKLVSEIDEECWQQIEIIGWLYQFYISEKKDEVIGKVVKSEDIPAATQLFTPNWIVKYMVQNSLGAQWMRTYPDSSLKTRMEYYIEPAEQTDEVKSKLKEITPDTINPEELTLLDPACGSGHILVEAYDLFKDIYLERGYRKRDIPELILTKNLYGLEIDDRAAPLAGFAVLMKARADDRSIFDKEIQPNVVSIQESKGIKAENEFDDLVNLFEHAKTYGSLIRVPEGLTDKLPELRKRIKEGKKGLNKQDLWTQTQYYEKLLSLANQAEMLSRKYDAVVANPPYLASNNLNRIFKQFVTAFQPKSNENVYAVFIERCLEVCKPLGNVGMMTPLTWMYIQSYEKLRHWLIDYKSVMSLVQPEYNAFWDSAHVAICSFVINNIQCSRTGHYVDLSGFYDKKSQSSLFLEAIQNQECGWMWKLNQDEFKRIPGHPFAFWAGTQTRNAFANLPSLDEFGDAKVGLQTGDNPSFIRYWYEVSRTKISFDSLDREAAQHCDKTWFPYNKGGDFRKWFGNNEHVVNWKDDGKEIRKHKSSVVRNPNYFFRESITWSRITSAVFGARVCPNGSVFDQGGDSLFVGPNDRCFFVGLLVSKVSHKLLKILNATVNVLVSDISKLPVIEFRGCDFLQVVNENVERAIDIAKSDWDSFETSYGFAKNPVLENKSGDIRAGFGNWKDICTRQRRELQSIETINNEIFIKEYQLEDELTPDVPIEQVTITVNPSYRYGGKLTEEEQWTRFRQDTMEELVSYAVGCMMGRYSLDQKGLVYAHAGNEGFDHNKYKTFPADDDGIVPITDHEWFDDDAACRFFRFIETAWNKDTLEDNLEFVADAIGRKTNESSRDSIHRYFVNGFIKDHLKTYKKRPIYWLITSGKQKAFQALVYLHRYNEGTLSRMRTEYVLPLQGKITTRMEHLEKDKDHASSTSAANKIQKEIGRLRKQKEELLKFDENLHHYADKKISLDLDDGVKVNYGKFGDLLAEVKAITGKK